MSNPAMNPFSRLSHFVDDMLDRGVRRRAFARVPCCAVASLLLRERAVELEGLILELSRGGALFREAATFVLDRRHVHVTIKLPNRTLEGVIVNSSRSGYGIRLDKILTEEEFDELIAAYGEAAAA